MNDWGDKSPPQATILLNYHAFARCEGFLFARIWPSLLRGLCVFAGRILSAPHVFVHLC